MKPAMHIIQGDGAQHLSLEKNILRALVYFDIFRYPLTLQEIVLFCQVRPAHLHEVEATLQDLCNRLLIFKFDDLYAIHNTIGIADRRRAGNKAAQEIMSKAERRARLIHAFPFVRSVNISGSLSKNYFDTSTDVDYFIITAPDRIWVTRLMLTFFKKVFLLNSRKYFCINYYIDSTHLAIPDHNLFAATEIITLKNVSGADIYLEFLAQNNWVSSYFPNFEAPSGIPVSQDIPFFKRITEFIVKGRFGDNVDNMCFKVMRFFLQKKYHTLNAEKFNVNMRADKHSSKHHPQGFQFKVLEAFEAGCIQFGQKHGITIH